MTFLADENVDKQIVNRLREKKYEVIYIAEISPSILDDPCKLFRYIFWKLLDKP